MANLELDPVFVKALRLLHSKSKESTEQLKQMMFDAINQVQKKSGTKDEANKSPSNRTSGKSSGQGTKNSEVDSNNKKKEAEKRNFDKLKQDIADFASATQDQAKKAKLDTSKSSSHSHSSSSSSGSEVKKESKDKPVYKEFDIFSSLKEVKEKPVTKERLKSSNIPEQKTPEVKSLASTNKEKYPHQDSDTETDSSNTDNERGMDADDFAVDMGIACVVCRQFDVSSGNQLVECQECHSLYHQECHKPPVINQDVNDPRFVWYCSKCQKNLKKMVSSKSQKTSKSSAPAPSSISSTTSTSSSSTFSFLKQPATSTSKPAAKTDSSVLQPFKRIDPVKPSSNKESPTGSRPMGLAGLAANLSGKSLDSGRSKTGDSSTRSGKDGKSRLASSSDSSKSAMSKTTSASDLLGSKKSLGGSSSGGNSSGHSKSSSASNLMQKSTFLVGADKITEKKYSSAKSDSKKKPSSSGSKDRRK
ncbi:uncharacterized protein LOC141912719 [Tubulanus polymorphus]|uniref:uncharacterized protein LOC141912719 n=1 Tax=Tubulanus polymorphus TaxID=672921 RepID=UPI003DA208CF